MGQTKSKTVDTRELREFAAEQYARFRNAIAEDDRPTQLAAIDEMEVIRKILEKKYTLPRLPKGYKSPNNDPDPRFIRREIRLDKYPLQFQQFPAEKQAEMKRDSKIYGEIDATLDKMRSQYTSQKNTRQKRTFHVAKLYGIDKRRQDIQSRITKRRLQHHTPLNETLRYGYKNTTKRYMRNYENEYRNQKRSKINRNTSIPTVASVTEQVAEQTLPGFSFFGWIRSFFGAQQKQQQQEQPQQEQQPQESEQLGPQLPSRTQPQQSQLSTPQSTLPTIDAEIQRATVGDRKASNRLLALTSDEQKREFLTQYIAVKNIREPNERDVAFGNFYEELEASSQRPSSPRGRYAPVPSTTEAAVIAASVQDSGAGVFPNRGGSRTRKHKRKPRHSK